MVQWPGRDGEKVMGKPFTFLAVLVLLIVAAAHAYRLYTSMAVTVGGHDVALWVSWPGAIVAGLLGLMVLVESRR